MSWRELPIFTNCRHILPSRARAARIRSNTVHFPGCGRTDDLGKVARRREPYPEETMRRPPCPPIIDALDPRVLLSLTLAAAVPAIDGGTITPLKKDDSGGDEGGGKKAKKSKPPEITVLLG